MEEFFRGGQLLGGVYYLFYSFHVWYLPSACMLTLLLMCIRNYVDVPTCHLITGPCSEEPVFRQPHHGVTILECTDAKLDQCKQTQLVAFPRNRETREGLGVV